MSSVHGKNIVVLVLASIVRVKLAKNCISIILTHIERNQAIKCC